MGANQRGKNIRLTKKKQSVKIVLLLRQGVKNQLLRRTRKLKIENRKEKL